MSAISSNGTGGGLWGSGSSWAGGFVPVEGDTVTIVGGDTITIDQNITVGDDTTTPAVDILSGGSFDWDNASDATITFKGDFYVRNGGTVNFDGTTNQQYSLTVKLNYSASLATNKYRCKLEAGATLISNGYDKIRSFDMLSVDASSGQDKINTLNDNSSNWNTNDSLIVTTTIKRSSGNGNDVRTISSFASNEITLNSNLTNTHLATYCYVGNLTRNIKWTSYNTTYASSIYCLANHPTISIVWTEFYGIGNPSSAGVISIGAYFPSLTMQNCSFHDIAYYVFAASSPIGNTADVYGNVIYGITGILLALARDSIVHDNLFVSLGTSSFGGIQVKIYNNKYIYFSNTSSHYNWAGGVSMEIYNNLFFACSGGIGNYQNYGLSNNVHNNEYYGLSGYTYYNAIAIGGEVYDETVGNTDFPCTTLVSIVSGGFINGLKYRNINGVWTTELSVASGLTSGSSINFSDINGTNRDFTVTDSGYIYRTGTGLADTTVRTAGGYAVRFESTSSTNELIWSQNIPTGNIQNKSMTVAVWCYINNAAYYAGTNQLPRLTINYDNGTTAYCQASSTAGSWQLLFVTFTPTTTYGQITVTLSTMTDATTTNAYVYFDDYSVLYPAGVQLSLGAMDLWANGLPVTPTISTNLSAQDVWTSASTTDYGTNTMGNKLKVLKNPSYLVDGEIIV